MERRLREYVDALFVDMPDTARTWEVRDEIYGNVLDRYHDLVSSGMTPEGAFERAKQSIGDTEDIRQYLLESQPDPLAYDANRKRKALFMGTGVGFLILSVGFVVLFSTLGIPVIGVFLMFACCAVGIGLITYSSFAYSAPRPQRIPREDASEYQQWKAEKIAGERRTQPYRSLLWILVTIAYFVISFATGAWGISWIVFLIGAAIEKLIEVVMA